MSYDTVINKCRDIEKLAETPAEKSFLQTASIFFLEVDQAELVHGEGIRKEFIRDVILALGEI